MPDDLTAGQDTTPGTEPTTEPTKPAAEPVTLTRADLEAILKANSDKFDGQLKEFGQQVAGAIQQGAQPQPATETTADPTNDDVARSLLDDPKSVIEGFVEGVIKDKLGPYFTMQIADRNQDLVAQHRKVIDNKYGDGTFKEEFEPELDQLLERLPPETRGSSTHIQSIIEGMVGRKIDELAPKAVEMVKKARETLEAPVMLTNGLAAPQKGKITEEERNFDTTYQRVTGESLDLPNLIKFRDIRRDNDGILTLEDYRSQFPKKGAQA